MLIEIHLHQLAASELAGFISSMNIVDGRFDKIERRVGLSHENVSSLRSVNLFIVKGKDVQG